MTESDYLSHKETENQELADELRPFIRRRDEAYTSLEEGIEEYKEFIMNRNRLNAIVGRPLLPTPWIKPEPLRIIDDDVVVEEDFDYDEGEGEGIEDDYDEEDYEDMDE